MLVRARAPLRLGLAGGGTDVSPYCNRYGGLVLNATIDKYAYTTIEPQTNGVVRMVAADQQEDWKGEALPELPLKGTLDLHKGTYNRIVRDFNGGAPLPLVVTPPLPPEGVVIPPLPHEGEGWGEGFEKLRL